jgi:hypothetical protein
MKTLVLFTAALLSTSVMAQEIEATCTPREITDSNFDLFDGASLSVRFDPRRISVERIDCNENEVGVCQMTGVFEKIVKSGSSMYSSVELMDIADQTDQGNIFVSQKLANGRNGEISFSVHQLGDSEGAWWMTETFDCKVSR